MRSKSLLVLFALLVCLLPVSAQGLSSFVIRDATDFWDLEGGDMKWLETLDQGQLLTINKENVKGKYKSKDYVLTKVTLDTGKSGYIIDSLVAKLANQAVVVKELATLYSQPKDSAVLSTIIPKLSFLAAWPVSGKIDFYKVSVILADGSMIKDRYMMSDDLSISIADVNASMLLSAVKKLKKKEQKIKLLQTLLTKYPNSAFADIATQAMESFDIDNMFISSSSMFFRCTDGITLREGPSIYQVPLKVVEKGTELESVSKTSEEYTVNGKKGCWILVKDPAGGPDGWVFDAYLEAIK